MTWPACLSDCTQCLLFQVALWCNFLSENLRSCNNLPKCQYVFNLLSFQTPVFSNTSFKFCHWQSLEIEDCQDSVQFIGPVSTFTLFPASGCAGYNPFFSSNSPYKDIFTACKLLTDEPSTSLWGLFYVLPSLRQVRVPLERTQRNMQTSRFKPISLLLWGDNDNLC